LINQEIQDGTKIQTNRVRQGLFEYSIYSKEGGFGFPQFAKIQQVGTSKGMQGNCSIFEKHQS